MVLHEQRTGMKIGAQIELTKSQNILDPYNLQEGGPFDLNGDFWKSHLLELNNRVLEILPTRLEKW